MSSSMKTRINRVHSNKHEPFSIQKKTNGCFQKCWVSPTTMGFSYLKMIIKRGCEMGVFPLFFGNTLEMDVDQAHQPGWSLPPGLVQFLPSQIVNDHLIFHNNGKNGPKIPLCFWCFKLSDLWKQQPSSNTQDTTWSQQFLSSIKSSVLKNISTVAGFFRRCSSSYVLGVSCPEKPWVLLIPKKTWDPSGDTQRWWKGSVYIVITYL